MFTSYRLLLLALTVLFLLGTYTHTLQRVEYGAYGLATRILPGAEMGGAVAVAAVDNAALEGIGPWPWTRDRLAATVDRLRRLEARAIGVLVPLSEVETPALATELAAEAEAASGRTSRALKRWVARLDTDRELARAVAGADNVVLAAWYSTTETGAGVTEPLAAAALESGEQAAPSVLEAPPPAPRAGVRAPIPGLVRAAAGVGVTAAGGRIHYGEPLAVRAGDRVLPGFVAVLAALALRMSPDALALAPGEGLRIGPETIALGPDWRLYPLPGGGEADEAPVPVVSVAELWESNARVRGLRGKTVLVGPTDPSLVAPVIGPGGASRPPVVAAAHALASLLADKTVSMPAGFFAQQRLLVAALAVLLLLWPPRWHGRAGLLIGVLGAVVLLNVELVMLLTRELWLPLAVPSFFLVVTQGLLGARRALGAWTGRARSELVAVRRELGANLKSQGRLDDAFAQYRACPGEEAMLEPLYELGLAFESRRQFAKAAAVYELAAGTKRSFRDVQDRLARLEKVGSGMPMGVGGGTKTVILDDSAIQKPTLGHYRLEREIGRGAMAVVYLATDSKLGRKVAIKALSLTEEFQGEALKDAQERFAREAEAAARLNHPSIVTIHEAGEDHDLAYIVMDYAEGESLENYTDDDELLPVPEVLAIGAQVADALHYAHERQVVHRDIKPSNIIYDTATGMAKVTDFGIACLIDSSRTRTGTVLGTPSYMSPEQASGKKLDGRSDLFSLGVTLYQLLTGRLPFVGDSFANLIYRITTQKHPALRKLRPDVHANVSRVINRVLQKEPERRYATGAELADALLRCQEKVAPRRRA